MKKPKKENCYRHSEICVIDEKTGGSFIEIVDVKTNTRTRSVFEEEGTKIARELTLDAKETAKLNKNLRELNSENFYFVVEDLSNEKILGVFGTFFDKSSIIIKYPPKKSKNLSLKIFLEEQLRNRVLAAINNLCVETGIIASLMEYRVN